MVSKKTLIGIVIVIAVIAVLLIIATAGNSKVTGNSVNTGSHLALEDNQVNQAKSGTLSANRQASTLQFNGHALGGLKSHDGTFDSWEASADYSEGKLNSLSGTIQTPTVNTGIPGLDSHLKSSDFLDATNNPQITFTSTSISDNSITGELTFRGITQEITFPAQISQSSVTADFVFDASEFGFSEFGVNEEVDISVNFVF